MLSKFFDLESIGLVIFFILPFSYHVRSAVITDAKFTAKIFIFSRWQNTIYSYAVQLTSPTVPFLGPFVYGTTFAGCP